MSVPVLINGVTYNYPVDGEPAGTWGQEASDAFVALADVVEGLSGTSDIIKATATINNNVSSATNIVGLVFDASVIFGAVITYHIKRTTSTNRSIETGSLYITQNSTTTPKWTIAKLGAGDGGLIISVTDAGQLQYTSTNMSGASYTGSITFSAKAYP